MFLPLVFQKFRLRFLRYFDTLHAQDRGPLPVTGMRNIRLDSLPNGRPVASRDCALCTRRRIRCDRTVPSCLKCASRNHECPGFSSINLKWDQGIASRGKFAGSMVPIHRGKASVFNDSMRKPHARRPKAITFRSPQTRAELSVSSIRYHGDLLEVASGALHRASQDQYLVNRCARVILLDRLLDHFSTGVVPRLTWIELPDNLWPTTLRSLAQGSRCLYLSLSCLAAAHLSATQIGTISERSSFKQLHDRLRELSLQSVNQGIARVLTNTPSGLSGESLHLWLTETLASIIALCYAEAFRPAPTRWKLHLYGCRTVVDRLSLHRELGPERLVEKFLLKEVADLEALSDFSTPTLMSPISTTRASTLACGNSFWGFTDLIREISFTEKKHQHASGKMSAIDMSAWHTRADESYHGIISNVRDMCGRQGNITCFESVARAHHYATVVYSYQALAPEVIGEATVALEALFTILKDMCTTDNEAMTAFWHDMFFPLLIAGTECSADEGLQAIVEHLYLTALSITGLWCNSASLQFLKSYWQRSQANVHMVWIQYVGNAESGTGPFIVF
ncbi:uncharacterized protein M421DRAFT_418955 [Didymella exigua CBS 183.55]|uniref:Zn(2)-C6 fungal-type domain-containing protein n=1 Tax=Didymella exigua CBS 183.55 TaxID=1150837 RepID=A0A6A5RRD7_9PLEO|nr:uncharacterized protein M421DRAFT_418955 [Didymella exigua CBS 183.55]KAF1929910.1 hypothetical protein M421DRAFT_418955 [Didymella exigua CBS 183.55]